MSQSLIPLPRMSFPFLSFLLCLCPLYPGFSPCVLYPLLLIPFYVPVPCISAPVQSLSAVSLSFMSVLHVSPPVSLVSSSLCFYSSFLVCCISFTLCPCPLSIIQYVCSLYLLHVSVFCVLYPLVYPGPVRHVTIPYVSFGNICDPSVTSLFVSIVSLPNISLYPYCLLCPSWLYFISFSWPGLFVFLSLLSWLFFFVLLSDASALFFPLCLGSLSPMS